MKKLTRILALVLALVMIMALAACGKTEEAVEPQQASAAPAELTTINVYRPYFLVQDDNSTKAVADAINAEIAQYGIQITLTDIAFADYGPKLNLELASGNSVDVFFTASWVPTVECDTLVTNKAALDLTELLPNYPQLVNSIPENFWSSAKYSGRDFFVPINKDMASGYVICCNPDVAEATGYTTDCISSLSDLAPFLEKAKELGYKYSFLNQNQGLFSLFGIDSYSRVIEGIAAITTDGSNKVVSYPATEEYKEYCTLMHDWADAGYINEEEATKSAPENAYTTADCAFTWCTESVPSSYLDTFGFAPVTSTVTDSWIVTGASLGGCYGINANTANPEAAMKVIELILSDNTVANLFAFGIEGVNYDLVDGKISVLPDSSYQTIPLLATSMEAVTPTVFQSDDFVASIAAMNDAAKDAPCLGFKYDLTSCSAEYAAVLAVYGQYDYMLETGFMDPEEYLPKYLEALDEAGIQVILDTIQSQLDAWLANK